MTTLADAAREFLTHKRLAVAGVSRKGDTAANAIYQKLRGAGYQVFALNPNATEVEGDRCYPNLAAIPGGVDGVVIGTAPAQAAEVVKECAALGIPRVWFHRSFGDGSADPAAIRLAREAGLKVIPAGCPLMFCAPVDPAHACLRWFLGVSGGLPRPENYA